VSAGPDPKVDVTLIEQARKQINRLAEEIAQLSEQDLSPPDYYGEFLQRLMTAIAAPAGAIWLRTAQGNLQLQYQINLRNVGIDRTEESRQTHDELLRQAILKGQPGFFPPQSGLGTPEAGKVVPGNPTDYVILLAPILVEKQVAGIIEIWQDPGRGPDAQRGFLHFIVRMAALAASYTRNHQLRQMTGQQQVWTQLEAFARQVHGTLNPTEVAYLIANEGRRLVECDRVSVAVRYAKRTKVEAISGADVVEKRSNLVTLMRALFDSVVRWNEKLVYTGTHDDTLPPDVNKALDEYLAESNSKLLAIIPLQDEREKEKKKQPRSALMMEAFDPSSTPDQLVARLEVVGKHATTALYNAVEHRRIPMRILWVPLAKVQEGLGGKARAILALIGLVLLAVTLVLVLVPGTLKVEAKGQLLPRRRALVYARRDGMIQFIPPDVKPSAYVHKGKVLMQMYDENLAAQITKYKAEGIAAEEKRRYAATAEQDQTKKGAQPSDVSTLRLAKIEAEQTLWDVNKNLRDLQQLHDADLQHPGVFFVRAPISGTILSSDIREILTNRRVRPNEPLLRLGQTSSKVADWEVELKIPQKNIGQVLDAYKENDPNEELDVDMLLVSQPTRVYKGKLARRKISAEANPNSDDNNETEPVVIARVRIDGPDIPKADRLPAKQLLTGTEVHAKVRCGQHALGYTLFYGVWEFFYEKVVFFF
jgi:hypothetical protein